MGPTNLACPFVVVPAYIFRQAVWLPLLVLGLSWLLVSNAHIDKDLGLGRLIGWDLLGLKREENKQFDTAAQQTDRTTSGYLAVPQFPGGRFSQVPNFITCIVIASGCALMVGSSIPILRPQYCIAAVFIGLLADVLDGLAARKLKATSKFGSAFDQLADLTCFGIGPAVFFIRAQLDGRAGFSVRELVCLFAGFTYMACSAARIARELVVHQMGRPMYFVGIPTNLASPVVVISVFLYPHAWCLPVVILILSCLLVSNTRVPKDLGLSQLVGRDLFGFKIALKTM